MFVFETYGLAVAILAASVLIRIYQSYADKKRRAKLGGAIPHNERHKVTPVNGQSVELSPSEAAMAHASLEFHGAMRITVNALMSGPKPKEVIMRGALKRLAASHPFLRCTIQADVTGNKAGFLATIDDDLEVPLDFIHLEHASLEQAWRNVWEGHEKVCAVPFL